MRDVTAAGSATRVVPLAYIAMGSNLGDPLAQLQGAVDGLARLGRLRSCSSLWRTAPVGGPAGQPDYLNAVAALEPRAPYGEPATLLQALLELERRQGRERRVRWAARTLDLDLLAWGERALDTAELNLPHPRMMDRPFVLAPLCELSPEWRHPITGETACEALERLPDTGIERTDLKLVLNAD